MQLPVIPTDIRSLTHLAQDKSFIGDITDVATRGLQRFYDDACDVGVALLNPKTGNVTYWTMVHELYNYSEGELEGWVLHPTWISVHHNPSLNGYTLKLIND